MAITQEALLEEALALPEEERATLADRLFASLDEPMEPDVEAAWRAEIEDRVAAYERGEVATYAGEEVFAEIRRRAG